jgi:CubicO group peptidase (beta-lactamase class C family)
VARDVANDADTRFRIASVTKQFTAMAVLMLQEDGELRVGDLVCTHLASCPGTWRAITIEQLLTHTSGLWDYNALTEAETEAYVAEFGERPTPAQLLQVFADRPLEFAPGAEYRYSNCGYDLLGVVVERLSGQSYGDFLHDRILAPLDMADSAYEPGRQVSDHDATGYQDWTTPATQFTDAVNFASGGMYSTVPDLSRWNRFLLTGRPAIVERDTLDQLLRPRVDTDTGSRYGYGIETKEIGGATVRFHGGILPGFRTVNRIQPGKDLSIVVMSNLGTAGPEMVADNLAALVDG